jgi:hypothetical protein
MHTSVSNCICPNELEQIFGSAIYLMRKTLFSYITMEDPTARKNWGDVDVGSTMEFSGQLRGEFDVFLLPLSDVFLLPLSATEE